MNRTRENRTVRERVQRGAYLLPSLFTIGNILLGFYAIVLSLQARFELAGVLIIVAAILDGLDGRIARLTNTESEFGREFDSLADVLTFGAVPAVITHVWGLSELGRIGWLGPLFYLVCCATRLARFNIQTGSPDRRHFVGLPTPAAAVTIAGLLLYMPDNEWKAWSNAVLLIALGSIGLLMVSTFRYLSFKDLDLRKRWSYRSATLLTAAVLVLAYAPHAAFLAGGLVYTSSAPVAWLTGWLRRRVNAAKKTAEPSSRRN